MLYINRKLLKRTQDIAIQYYPNEFCGFFWGSILSPERVIGFYHVDNLIKNNVHGSYRYSVSIQDRIMIQNELFQVR